MQVIEEEGVQAMNHIYEEDLQQLKAELARIDEEAQKYLGEEMNEYEELQVIVENSQETLLFLYIVHKKHICIFKYI